MFGRSRRDHRLEQQELDALASPGHPHDHVVGLGRQGLLARSAPRDGPQVVVPEELLGVGHVVAAVHPGLDVEQLLGDPQVRREVGRHRRHRLEQVREDACVGADERVVRVADVEVHRPVVGVHRDLDAVADVVESGAAEAGSRARSLGSNAWALGSGPRS